LRRTETFRFNSHCPWLPGARALTATSVFALHVLDQEERRKPQQQPVDQNQNTDSTQGEDIFALAMLPTSIACRRN